MARELYLRAGRAIRCTGAGGSIARIFFIASVLLLTAVDAFAQVPRIVAPANGDAVSADGFELEISGEPDRDVTIAIDGVRVVTTGLNAAGEAVVPLEPGNGRPITVVVRYVGTQDFHRRVFGVSESLAFQPTARSLANGGVKVLHPVVGQRLEATTTVVLEGVPGEPFEVYYGELPLYSGIFAETGLDIRKVETGFLEAEMLELRSGGRIAAVRVQTVKSVEGRPKLHVVPASAATGRGLRMVTAIAAPAIFSFLGGLGVVSAYFDIGLLLTGVALGAVLASTHFAYTEIGTGGGRGLSDPAFRPNSLGPTVGGIAAGTLLWGIAALLDARASSEVANLAFLAAPAATALVSVALWEGEFHRAWEVRLAPDIGGVRMGGTF